MFKWTDKNPSNFYKGVCFTAPPYPIDSSTFEPIVALGANSIAIIPYAFASASEHYIKFNHPRQWWGEKEEGVVYCIEEAKRKGLKIMLKPHIWFGGGMFHGDYEANSETNWEQIESDYRDYLLFYTKIAETYQVDILCIGTELKKWVQMRPRFWEKLITEIKTIYSGKLTYAANWDSYKKVIFWNDLDYIGVDAYFPLSNEQSPSLNDLKSGWKIHYEELKKTSEDWQKPIIFAEFGYRNVDFAAKEPWDSSKKTGINHKNQELAYQALFETFFNEDWFAGGFLWKWHSKQLGFKGEDNNRFTPQNKPVEETIRKHYKQLK